MWGPRWAAQITPTVFVWCPFTPCGTQSSFAPWLPSGTHAGHVVQVVFWHMGPMWAAPDLSHVGFWYMGPMWEAPDLPHVGYWYMGPMWATGIWDPCGQPQIYPMWASGIWDPCGKPQIYPMWASGIWDPCWKPQIYPMWASGIWDACGLPRSPPLFMYGALLAQVGPSRHLHRGTHLGPMLVIAILYLNLTYFWYLLTLGLVVTDCYLKYMYQTICEIDPCLIIEQNQRFVNVPNF